MNNEQFEDVFNNRIFECRSVMSRKSSEYASNDDKLHNFKVAAQLQGCSEERALGGFLAKHIVSIFDLINSEHYVPKSIWDEKIGDALNYLFLLDAMVAEKMFTNE